MRRNVIAAALLGALAALPAAAQDNYPSRPIRFVVPFAAGGPSDIVARIMAPHMQQTLGQPVVVDNRPGAGGVTGVDVVAKAAPDGYMFGIGSAGALAISPNLGRGTPYDPVRDLAPITLGVLVPEPVVVPAVSPYRTLQDLITDARARPGALNFGTTGNGSMPHLAAEQLRAAAGLDIVQIAYNSGGQLATAVLRNEVQLGFADLPVLLPQINAGAMRALAVGTPERLTWIPDVPTFRELGLPSVDASNWHGLVAPARTQPAALEALRRAAIAALQDPDVRRRLHDQGAIPGGNPAEEFGAFIRSENAKWHEVIQRNNIRPD
ncbi:Bug family tripartite tricarboxylate transporter substrate binding protein [Neoroseomonas oryzicola]|uniref:Tripartite tricarboxylate transporter substrate binding protein n=1 Tax=Neoroseomonas oryzicola TaxID=535904 RepID=A0A9X9WFG4_9PROT|nr:tripartite tricarboxylate transporter substrate-binding protein [Neoroseomonas oryzicola]MBR0659074.1 tripartite tricarboxylate transporter substrate binding protein [Neoroseomonas oryzicola]NKE17011.1 tripartite tricarboxylate transporter substrate binding protein [Neoroseomonas oryzicola]